MQLKRELVVKKILGPLIRTHWGRRIMLAARRGRFIHRDAIDGGRWTVCACGKVHSRKPYGFFKGNEGENPFCPQDTMLRRLGQDFCKAVLQNEIVIAAEVLVQVEARASEIM